MQDQAVADLVQAAAAGDQVAWEALVERFAGLVWAVVRGHRLPASEAADVFQVTWLKAVEHLAAVREPERFGGWLATTARRESLRVIRSKSRETATEPTVLDLTTADAPPPGAHLEQQERAEALWRCFQASSERCQQLLRVLIADPPPSYLDVASTLDMPVGSIGPTRQRCLEHLRRRLVEAGVDADRG